MHTTDQIVRDAFGTDDSARMIDIVTTAHPAHEAILVRTTPTPPAVVPAILDDRTSFWEKLMICFSLMIARHQPVRH